MSKMHTPGPWTVYEPDSGVTYGISGEDGTAVVFWGETVNDGINKLEDARLIAAAPELLDALVALASEYDAASRSDNGPGWEAELQPQMIAARAAIAKATGVAS